MTEQELRAMVREAIARQQTGHAVDQPPPRPAQMRLHASHAAFALEAGGDGDGACIIEPAVACNHCGYCKSLGH